MGDAIRLECTTSSSRKFWQATLDGVMVHVRWGRIGSEGRQTSHRHADPAAAQAERDKMVRGKLRKGYQIVEGDLSPSMSTAAPSTAEAVGGASLPKARSSKRTRPTPAEARARASLMEPRRSAAGVLVWSLARESGSAAEYFELSVAGREIEIARARAGRSPRIREIVLEAGEAIDARVVGELAKAISEGFIPAEDAMPIPPPPEEPPADPIHAEAVRWLQREKRRGYLPVTAEGMGRLNDSRFGGYPALLPDESPPACGLCHHPLTLIVQLAHESLPEEAQRLLPVGLIQLLWCDSICQSEDGWEPFSPTHRVRVIEASATLREPSPEEMAPQMYSPQHIVTWSPVDTYPAYSDGAIDDAALFDAVDALCNEEAGGEYVNRGGERLLGWPHWIQDPIPVTCRNCRAPMSPLLQVDTNKTVKGLGFGDSGIGFLMVCRCHTMTLVWQSC